MVLIPLRAAARKALLNYGFSTSAWWAPAAACQWAGPGGFRGLLLAEKSRLQGLEQTVTLPESAEAPVRQGDVLGTLTVTQNGARSPPSGRRSRGKGRALRLADHVLLLLAGSWPGRQGCECYNKGKSTWRRCVEKIFFNI